MPITPKAWANRPSALNPNVGETLADWETRVAAYAAANPGVLTPADAAALIDLETRMGAYADTAVASEASARATAVSSEATARTAADTAEVTARNAAITAHEADTTAVHGIADTATLVLTSDGRLKGRFRGAWAATTFYAANDLVTNGGNLWSANADFTSGGSFNAANWTQISTGSSGGLALTPTGVKTANYTAAASDLVPVDTTSGAVTITLPTAPADKTAVAVKHVTQGGTNAVTVARGGTTDVFNKAGGSTSLSLVLVNQAVLLEYSAATGIWYVLADDLPLSALDTRYSGAVAAFVTDARGNMGASSTTTFGTEAWRDISGTLNANHVETFAGLAFGKHALLRVIQDAVGGRTLSVSDGTNTVSVPINTAALKPTDVLVFAANGTDIDAMVLGNGFANPMTAAQDLIVGGASGLPGRLGVGSNGQVLGVAAGAVGWVAGGLTNPMTALNDLILGGASGAPARLAVGTNGQALIVSGGNVVWGSPSDPGAIQKAIVTTKGDIIVATASGTVVRLGVGTDGQVLTADSTQASGVKWAAAAGGGGAIVGGINPFLSGVAYLPPMSIAGTNQSKANGVALAIPFIPGVSANLAVMRVSVQATATAAVIRLGVYSENATTGKPNTLLLDAGTVDAASATGVKAITGLSLALTAGTRYWLVGVQQLSSAGNAGLKGTTQSSINPNCPNDATNLSLGVGWTNSTGMTGALPASTPAGDWAVADTAFAIEVQAA